MSIPARQAARMLGLGPETISAYCRRGIVQGHKEIVHQVGRCDGVVQPFPEGLEMWMVDEVEVERLKRERGIK